MLKNDTNLAISERRDFDLEAAAAERVFRNASSEAEGGVVHLEEHSTARDDRQSHELFKGDHGWLLKERPSNKVLLLKLVKQGWKIPIDPVFDC